MDANYACSQLGSSCRFPTSLSEAVPVPAEARLVDEMLEGICLSFVLMSKKMTFYPEPLSSRSFGIWHGS